MKKEVDEYLDNSFKLSRALEQMMPKDVSDYIMELIAKDKAHKKYLNIVEENESDSSI